MHTTHTNHTKLLLGGVIVGGLAALLLAPRSGKETRARMAEKAQRLRDTSKQITEDITDQARKNSEEVAAMLHKEKEGLKGTEPPVDMR